MSTFFYENETENKRTAFISELLALLKTEESRILGVKGISGYPLPPSMHNDGYGDQRDKMPDILARDLVHDETIIGIVRLTIEEIESEQSLTELDVFFDQKDNNGQPCRILLIVPSTIVAEVNSCITHYLHRDLWQQLTIVAGKKVFTKSK